jgi:ribosomal protein S2
VFVSNVLKSYNVCHEAMCLKIATLGIVDTNSPQKYVNLAIPGNDESFTTLVYYNNLISLFVLYNKFTLVYS